MLYYLGGMLMGTWWATVLFIVVLTTMPLNSCKIAEDSASWEEEQMCQSVVPMILAWFGLTVVKELEIE